ncbi:asparagine synthase (glutamine-hydrolyzing) [Nitratifractor sp.]
MCAIFGIVGEYKPDEAREAFRRLSHRGPDDSRLVLQKEGAFGVHRLAIESAGEPMAQPLVGESGEILLFNGEIYNYRELGRELGLQAADEAQVLLAAWKEWGEAFVNHLRGMYALAIYDPAAKRLQLWRDPAGKKPLFYLQNADFFAFASEAKALYALKPFALERRHLPQYFGFQATVAPLTLDRHVRKLAPGESMMIELPDHSKSKIQNLSFSCYDPWLDGSVGYRGFDEAVGAVGDALREAVALRIPRKVSWGVLLSGGLDSSLVAALSREASQGPIRTYSIGYEGYAKYDERPWAEQMARHLDTEHRSVSFGKKEFFETLEELLPLMDEPMADPAQIPLYFLMKYAAAEGTRVLLGGEGSDELFLGYSAYRDYREMESLQEMPLPKREWLYGYLRRNFSMNREWEWYKRALEGTPIFRSSAEIYTDLQLSRLLRWNVRDDQNLEAIAPYLTRFKASGRSDPADWYSYLDLKILLGEVYLVKQDRVSMAAGIEARSPFLDRRVIETAFSTDPKLRWREERKALLKALARPLLPEQIVSRRKKGLNYPFIEWILQEDGLEAIGRMQERWGILDEEHWRFLAQKARKGRFRQHLFPLYLLAKWLARQG